MFVRPPPPPSPRNNTAWKTLRTACTTLPKVINARVNSYFEENAAEMDKLFAEKRPAAFTPALERHNRDGTKKTHLVNNSSGMKMVLFYGTLCAFVNDGRVFFTNSSVKSR